MKLTFDNATLELTPAGKTYRISSGDEIAEVEIVRAENGKLDLLVDGRPVNAYVSSDGAERWVTVNGRTYQLTKQSGRRAAAGGQHHAAGELTAPMPGQVRAVNVSAGDAVTKGQTLIVLEAMKMEMKIQAPMDGIVSSLSVEAGQTVEREQVLVEIVDRLES